MEDADYWSRELLNVMKRRSGAQRSVSEESRLQEIIACVAEGGDIQVTDHRGRSLLQLSEQYKYFKIKEYLLISVGLQTVREKQRLIQPVLSNRVEAGSSGHGLAGVPRNDGNAYGDEASSSRHGLAGVAHNEDDATMDEGSSSGNELEGVPSDNIGQQHESEHEDDAVKQIKKKRKLGRTESMETKTSRSKVDILQEKEEYPSSGLRNSFHGNIYQVKLLMLFIYRAMKHKRKFLIATEMDAACKFDDLFLKYENDRNDGFCCRFLQAKHKITKDKKEINFQDLNSDNDGEFSLPKYIRSFLKITANQKFERCEIVDFIICTNIGLNVYNIPGVEMKPCDDEDPYLNMSFDGGKSERFQLSVDKTSKLFKTLRNSSELNKLASELLKNENKSLSLKTDLIKQYRSALVQNCILDVTGKSAKYSDAFIKNDAKLTMSPNSKALRRLLIKNKYKTEKKFLDEGANVTFKVSDGFKNYDGISSDLPSLISDDQITEFFNKLVFTVNSLNEDQLGKMIANEIGNEDYINLFNAEPIASKFFEKVVDWMKQKVGTYFDYKEAEKFFRDAGDLISKLVVIGPTEVHTKRLKIYGNDFRFQNNSFLSTIDKFLKYDSPKFETLVVTTAATFLTELKVFQVLVKVGANSRWCDTYIFCNATTINAIHERVVRAFCVPEMKLMVIVCCHASEAGHFILKDATLGGKKLVIICETMDQANDGVRVLKDETQFDDFAEHSRKKINETTIHFLRKGNEIRLYDIFENETRLFTAQFLSNIISEQPVVFGNELEQLNDIEEYYVPRFLRKKYEVSSDFFENKFPGGVFLIFYSQYIIPSIDLDNESIVIINDSIEHARSEFMDKCRNSTMNVHLIAQDPVSSRWVLYCSRGSVEGIRRFLISKDYPAYVAMPRNESTIFEEFCYQKFTVLTDVAGMGKSTVLTKLSHMLHKERPNLWIIRLNLNNFTRLFSKTNNLTNAVEYLIDYMLNIKGSQYKLQTELERELLKSRIQHNGKVALIFDGFDEVCPTYKDLCLQLLRELGDTNIEFLWVTTRPQQASELEHIFETTSYSLLVFDFEDQVNFLIKYWQSVMQISRSEKLEKFAKTILITVTESLETVIDQRSGIPLLTKIIGEAYANECLENLKSTADDTFHRKSPVTLHGLYKKFLEAKFRLYQEEKNQSDLSKPGVIYEMSQLFEKFEKQHTLLALFQHFDATTFQTLFANTLPTVRNSIEKFIRKIKEENERTGIVNDIHDDQPIFIHQTFVEFFVASYFVSSSHLLESTAFIRVFIESVLCEKSASNIRRFINSYFLEHIKPTTNRQMLKIGEEIKEMYTGPGESAAKIKDMFSNLVSEHSFAVADFVMDCLAAFPSLLKDLLNYESARGTALENIYSGEWGLVRKMIQFGAVIKNENVNLLCVATEFSTDIFKWLLNEGANVNGMINDENQIETPIMAAIRNNREDIVRVITQHPDFFLTTTKEKLALFTSAASYKRYGIIEYLLTHFKMELKSENVKLLMLEKFANQLDLEGLEFLIEMKKAFEDETEGYTLALKFSSKSSNRNSDMEQVYAFCRFVIEEKMVSVDLPHTMDATKAFLYGSVINEIAVTGNAKLLQFFISKGARIDFANKRGYTLLHFAVESGNLETVQLVMEKFPELLEIPDEEEQIKPLLHAAYLGKLEVLQYLLQYHNEHTLGFNINDKMNVKTTVVDFEPEGYNVLQMACLMDDFSIVEWLVSEEGGNCDMSVTFGSERLTLLHKACKDGFLHTVQVLVNESTRRKNSCLAIQTTRSGQNALHLAVINERSNIVKFLSSLKNVNYNTPDQKGYYPCHYSVMKKNMEIVEYFVKYLHVDLNLRTENEDGDTMLHLAVERHKKKVVDLLLASGASVNTISKSGSSVLYWSYSEKENWELTETLLNFGADINRMDYGMTMLHHAMDSEYRFENFKFLFDRFDIDLDQQEKSTGDTLLHLAVKKYGSVDVLQFLLQKGADTAILNMDGKSAYDLALQLSMPENVCSMLKPFEENQQVSHQ